MPIPWDAENDGIAIGSVKQSGGIVSNYFAGILPNTDLGALRTEPAGSATWSGRIIWYGNGVGGDNLTGTDFTLNVNYTTKKLVATIQQGLGPLYYRIRGGYTATGTLNGVVQRAQYASLANAVAGTAPSRL